MGEDPMMLALDVEPMGGGDWRWRWYDHDSGTTLADGVESGERSAWTAALTHYVERSDECVRALASRAEAAEQRAESAEVALAAARAEVARLRAAIVDAAVELPVWPEGAYQTPTERDVSAVRAALYAALGVTR